MESDRSDSSDSPNAAITTVSDHESYKYPNMCSNVDKPTILLLDALSNLFWRLQEQSGGCVVMRQITRPGLDGKCHRPNCVGCVERLMESLMLFLIVMNTHQLPGGDCTIGASQSLGFRDVQ